MTRVVVAIAVFVVSLIVAAPVATAQSEGDSGAATALADAVELLSALETATRTDDFGDGEVGEVALLLDRGPAILRRLYEHRVDVPPLVRLALSGDSMVDLDAAHAGDSLPIVFATAATQLEDLADEGDGTGSARTGQGVSLPIGALVGVVAAVALPLGAMWWFRRRADRMEELSLVDPLTGLANRRRLDRDLERLDAERAAARQPVSVAMIDVDEFKRFNDTFGHREGDVALQHVSATIAAAVRASDSVYRYGGEEFLVLLRNAPQTEAIDVCEGIRLAVASLPNLVTVSIGVATGNDEPVPTLTVAADEALYRAKADGRNRIVATSVINRDGARVSSV